MRKKIVTGMLAASLVWIMTGCCLSHDWQEATCTEPKTCSKCGETEGEALEHIWEEATCTEPKICRKCGGTEGEALGHTLSEATYWEAAVCSVCGETVGDVLPPAFEELGVKGQFMEVGKTYDYHTLCHRRQDYEEEFIDALKEGYGVEGDYATLTEFFMEGASGGEDSFEYNGEALELTEENLIAAFSDAYGVTGNFENLTDVFMASLEQDGIDLDARTTAQAVVMDYQVFDSDETHEAKEGYEWKTVEVELMYSDENAWDYGCMYRFITTDYYQKDDTDDEENDGQVEDLSWDNEKTHTINWKGQEYTECRSILEVESGEWVEEAAGWQATDVFRFAFLLPKGYDGKLLGFLDVGYTGTIHNFAYADDDTLFFRLQ